MSTVPITVVEHHETGALTGCRQSHPREDGGHRDNPQHPPRGSSTQNCVHELSTWISFNSGAKADLGAVAKTTYRLLNDLYKEGATRKRMPRGINPRPSLRKRNILFPVPLRGFLNHCSSRRLWGSAQRPLGPMDLRERRDTWWPEVPASASNSQ